MQDRLVYFITSVDVVVLVQTPMRLIPDAPTRLGGSIAGRQILATQNPTPWRYARGRHVCSRAQRRPGQDPACTQQLGLVQTNTSKKRVIFRQLLAVSQSDIVGVQEVVHFSFQKAAGRFESERVTTGRLRDALKRSETLSMQGFNLTALDGAWDPASLLEGDLNTELLASLPVRLVLQQEELASL